MRVRLNGRDLGVYLRSVRPGDDLCAAEARPVGTFFKGDSIGSRTQFALWEGSASWRAIGRKDQQASDALDELLSTLREPPSVASSVRLSSVLDLEKMARAMAVASLAGSIHADAVHNHVLFYDYEKQQLEPLPWDANGFGIHAEPELAVDVARHALAARLLCSPDFLHRRNEVLWQMLHGEGRADRMVAAIDQRLASLDVALRSDPEIARLVLRRGVFEVDALDYEELLEARAEFVQFVEWREAHLKKWFGAARVSVTPSPNNPEHSLVTVFGTVAIKVSRRDGEAVVAADGRDASLLWPVIGERLIDVRQLQPADGRGVSAPHGVAAPLHYTVACPAEQLLVRNAFTDEEVNASAVNGVQLFTRSLHPWQHVRSPATPR